MFNLYRSAEVLVSGFWWRGFLFLPVVARFLVQNLIHFGRSNIAQHSQFLNGSVYRYKYYSLFSVDNELWGIKIIMMCYNPKQCLIVCAISVKSVVLFPNAEFIPVPEIYFKTAMGQIKISVYFVHSKFRLPAKDLVKLLIIELYTTTCYQEKTLSIFTSKSVSVSVTCTDTMHFWWKNCWWSS